VNTARQQQHDDPGSTNAFLSRAEEFLRDAIALQNEIRDVTKRLEGNPAAVRAARELIVSNLGVSRLATAIENLSATAMCADVLQRRDAAPRFAQPPQVPDGRHLRMVAR